jgi:hypothetical protein
LYR